MNKRIAKGLLLFLLGVAVGVLSQHLPGIPARSNQEGTRLQISGRLPFSLSERDRAVVAFLSPEMSDLSDHIAALEQAASALPGVHLLFAWDRRMPDALPLEHQFNSYVLEAEPRDSFPSYYVVDTAYTILYKTSDLPELQENLADWIQ